MMVGKYILLLIKIPIIGLFEACDLVKVIDPEFDLNYVKMWWKHDEGYFEEDLKSFRDDGDDPELAMYSVGNNCEVEILCEPKLVTGEVTFMDRVNGKGKGKICDENDDKLSEGSDESSDEFVRGVHFDDSDEEKTKVFDEGLDKWVDPGVDGEHRTEHVANNETPSEPVKKIFIIEEMGKEHVIEDSYMIDELDSGGDDDS